MLKSLLLAMTLGVVSLNAQTLSPLAFPPEVTVQSASPQQISDAVGAAIKANPDQVPLIFDSALLAMHDRGSPASQDVRNSVAAITCALAASIPEDSLPSILKPAFEKHSGLILPMIATLSAINSQKEDKALKLVVDTPMNLGNIRVLKVEGGKVEFVDASGSVSNLKEEMFVRQGAKITTGKNESVDLVFENGSVLQIKPETDFYIDQFTQAPFVADHLDYRTLPQEPSSSRIKLSVAEGTIVVDVAKLKKESRYEVFTPLGAAGIRGTSFYVTSKRGSEGVPVSIGVAEGQVQFTTNTGDAQSVSTGQAFDLNMLPSGIAFTPNPVGFANLLAATLQLTAQLRQTIVGSPFIGAPVPIPASQSPLEKLPSAQRAILEQADQLGNPILLQVVRMLAQENPSFAPQIAAAAAELSPPVAVQIALEVARLLPAQVPRIGAYVSSATPYQAPAVASALAGFMPDQTLAIVAAVIQIVPAWAPLVATSIVRVLPDQASAIVMVVAKILPAQSVPVAQGVSLIVPSQGDAINAALSNGVGNPASLDSLQDAAQNPSSLNQPSPTPTPSPSPAQPPKVTPVSPSA
jgi:hypothetical protein